MAKLSSQGFADRASHIGFEVHLPENNDRDTQPRKDLALLFIGFNALPLCIIDGTIRVFSRISVPIGTVDLYDRSIKQQEINTSKEALYSWCGHEVLTSENKTLSRHFECNTVLKFRGSAVFACIHSPITVLPLFFSFHWIFKSLCTFFAHSFSDQISESSFDTHFMQMNLNAASGEAIFLSEFIHASPLKVFFSNGLRPFFSQYCIARIRAINMLPIILFDLICLMRFASCELFTACFACQGNECWVSIDASFEAYFTKRVQIWRSFSGMFLVKVFLCLGEWLVALTTNLFGFFWEEGKLRDVIYYGHSFVSPIQILSSGNVSADNAHVPEKHFPNYTTKPLPEQVWEVVA